MNQSLYIIGNGFDIYHGLPTRFADFHRYVEQHNLDLENQFEDYFTLRTDEQYLWSNFEEDLSSFSYRSFFDTYDHTDTSSESFQRSDFFGVEDEITEEAENLVQQIREAFGDWIEDIEMPTDTSAEKLFQLDKTARYINFNYTSTLESLYQVPREQILYVHNKAEEYSGSLVFGHGKKEEADPALDELDEEGNSNRGASTNAENAARSVFYEFIKDTDEVIVEHDVFFKSLEGIRQVYVLGHSLGEADWPYFKWIAGILPQAAWNISYYGPAESESKRQLAADLLGLQPDQVNMIVLDKLP